MTNRRNLKAAFGKPDPDFIIAVNRTLDRLQTKEEKPVKTFKRAPLIAAAILMILASVAYAAVKQWGIMDFIRGYRDPQVLPSAEDIIQTDLPQTGGDGRYASVRVRQALFDGSDITLVMAFSPAKDALLIGQQNNPDDGVETLGIDPESGPATIAEYAEKNGLTLCRVGAGDFGDGFREENGLFYAERVDWAAESNGTLAAMVRGRYTGEKAQTLRLNMTVSVYPMVKKSAAITREALKNAIDEIINAGSALYRPVVTPKIYEALANDNQVDETEFEEMLSFLSESAYFAPDAKGREKIALVCDVELPQTELLGGGHSAQPVDYADCGVRVERVTLALSPMSTRAEIEFCVIDEAAFAATDDGLWFEFIDEYGERLPDGIGTDGSIEEIDNGRYRQVIGLGAMARLPETVTLRGYNAWEKNRYEAHEIPIVAD